MSERVRAHFERVARAALDEDLGGAGPESDVTTMATVPEDLLGEGIVLAKQRGVLCGLAALESTFDHLSSHVAVHHEKHDGDEVHPGDVVARVTGPVRVLLTGERTALNLITHLSGVATTTRAHLDERVEVTDLRKTIPGLRALQKYAVRVGGGKNHRMGLWDAVLIKDNHVVAAGGTGEAVRRAKRATTMPVEVECASLEEIREALDAGADTILLDNFEVADLPDAVSLIKSSRPDVKIEVSGGVTMESVRAIAACGVDRISIGALTHSAPALDLSFELVRTWDAPRG